MSTPMTLTSFDADMKDMYAMPGTQLKQWVVDVRRETTWERETCPKFVVPMHYDECDDVEAASGDLRVCASVGETSWNNIYGRECRFCDGFAQAALLTPQMISWCAEKAGRPPICSDRSKLSDEYQEEWGALADNPLLKFITGSK